ncbi:hypothetical protein FGO68_gene1647 [Halteria grandinella]|uniref:Uncharacterized protein n=1 Tax=Halteria grandinella TaxID=5974 RepID=A0A8J8NDL7_HALGN|nr:hypothetical protein FGO68_gene1647 [Halteria grandinella]
MIIAGYATAIVFKQSTQLSISIRRSSHSQFLLIFQLIFKFQIGIYVTAKLYLEQSEFSEHKKLTEKTGLNILIPSYKLMFTR